MKVPIPSDLWQRLQAFAEGKWTGQVTLNFKAGMIESADVREHIPIRKKTLDKARGSCPTS